MEKRKSNRTIIIVVSIVTLFLAYGLYGVYEEVGEQTARIALIEADASFQSQTQLPGALPFFFSSSSYGGGGFQAGGKTLVPVNLNLYIHNTAPDARRLKEITLQTYWDDTLHKSEALVMVPLKKGVRVTQSGGRMFMPIGTTLTLLVRATDVEGYTYEYMVQKFYGDRELELEIEGDSFFAKGVGETKVFDPSGTYLGTVPRLW